ncbi:MAG: hypothetical protein J0H61_02590 [Alphaproteobacteria bacterium]|nr:hypothetical protein [Alphaproteobacteria bacterium]
MIPSQDKSGQLQNLLGKLPEAAAGKLARAVEMDRLMDGDALPHEIILAGLRPSLRQADRTLTPLRLFCQPFEDLLSSEARVEKQKAVIARASLVPVWSWLGADLLAKETHAYFRDTKAAILAGRIEEAAIMAQVFQLAAGKAMRGALAGDGAGPRKRLNADEIADADEMALLLCESEEMLKVQQRVPKHLAHLTEEILWQLRESYDALIARNPDAAPYVAVVTMNRLQRPWEALRLPLMVSRQTGDALISKTDMGLAGEILFARMDHMRAGILAARHPVFDAAALVAQVGSFAELSSAVVKEIEVRRDGEWGQRLLKDRAAIGAVMDGFMERAGKEVIAALPMQKGTGDFARPTLAEKRELALRYTQLVAGTRIFAAAGSFAAKQRTALEDCSNHLRRYVENAIRELRSAGGDKRATIESQLQFCADLAALLFSPEEAELIRRRVRAAQSAAA